MSGTEPLRSLEDLRRLKQEVQRTMRVREATGTTIVVGMGTCGIAAGAREVMHAVMRELARHNIDAHVTTTGCTGLCSQEPRVDIAQAGGAPVTYGKVTPDMVPRIISEHLIHGRPVEEWVLGKASGA